MTQPPQQPWDQGQPAQPAQPPPPPGQWGPAPEQWQQQPGQQPGQWPQQPGEQQPGQWQQPGQPAYQPPPGQPGGPAQWAQTGWDRTGWEQTGSVPAALDQAGWDQLGPIQGGPIGNVPDGYPASRKRRRTPLIIATIAAVVIAGGGVATYLAVSDKGSSASGGSSTPQAAITSIVNDLNKSDVLGVLDHLPPAERDALLNPIKDGLDNAKRLHVVKSDTDLSKISGTQVNAQNLTFAPDTVHVNDHVDVVQLTGGTITVNSDLTKVPFTDEFLKTAFPRGLPPQATHNGTVDIAKFIRDRNDGKPIRLAAEKVGGKWYPSIMYTIADNAAHDAGIENPGEPIPAKGASSAEDAVRQAVDALLKQDYQRLIELTSPDEARVLHDYGNLILRDAPKTGKAPFTITNLGLASKGISGGATRVTLTSVTFESGGEQGTITIDGNCVKITASGQAHPLCADQAVQQIAQAIGKQFTSAEQTAITHLFAGLANVGLDVSQSGGAWYVDPFRSTLDLSNALLSGLQGNDLLTLIALIPGR